MNLTIETNGLNIDGQRITATVRQSMGGGRMRLDEQDIQGADDPTSKVEWRYSGWEPRTLTLSIEVSTALASGGGDVRGVLLGLLHNASRETEGDLPATHRLAGDRLAAAGATDSDWIITGDPEWDDDGVTNELSVSIGFREFDPQRTSLVAGPPPSADEPAVDPPTDADLVSDDDQRAVDRLLDTLPDEVGI